MEWYLPLIWAGIIGSAVVLYVILDGFDLGIGMLFPFARDDKERDQMMASIAPFWDGNETWLVMGGVGLLVAFPLAYAIVMPALYLPVIGPAIAVTFALFIVVYGIIFSAGIYFINRLIAKGLDAASADEPAVSLGGALAAASRSTER